MRIIYNSVIPVKGFMAICICGLIFVRNEYREQFNTSPLYRNHEMIHAEQQKELGYIFFYILYVLEWIYRLIFHTKTAYRGISFEVEAYNNQNNYNYLKTRKHFAQWRKQ